MSALAAPLSIQGIFELQQAHRLRMAQSTAAERKAILTRLKNALIERRADFVAALALDLGKSSYEADMTELGQVIGGIQLALRELDGWMQPRLVGGPIHMPLMTSLIVPEPKGTVLILGPWNYPVTNLLSPLVDALAAGNTVMLKPSEKAPATAAVIRQLVEEHFDPKLLAVIEGDAAVAQQLTALPFDHILFTGSTAVGRKVLSAAAPQLTSITLELGGKSPVIVHESADLNLAAQRVVWGKLMNNGQTCIAPDHVWIPRALQAPWVAAVTQAIEQQYGPTQWIRHNPDYGRLIDADSAQRLEQLVQGSLALGAVLEYGGEVDAEARYMAPTVVSEVRPSMPLMSQEIFGPVMPVLPYDDLQSVLDYIRQGPSPLTLYAFCRDEQTKQRIRQQTRSGSLVFGGTMVQISNHHLPFGGRGQSGMGHYHGVHGFLTFSHQRAVLNESPLNTSGLAHAPFSGMGARFAGWLSRQLWR